MSQEFFGKSFEEIILARERELKRKGQEENNAKKREEEEQERIRVAIERFNESLIKREEREDDLVSRTLKAILELPDFNRIFREFHSIPDLLNKLGYIDRIIYEKLTEYAGEGLFSGPQTNTLFHHRLQEIGLNLLCPYLRLKGANETTHQDCTIDDEVIMTLCNGRYDSCVIFKDRMMRAAQGLIKIRLPEVKVPQPVYQECLVDLNDLDDWWKGEGKYE